LAAQSIRGAPEAVGLHTLEEPDKEEKAEP
jgi:hypothetical protein